MKRIFFSAIVLAAALVSASCSKEEDPAKPVDYAAPEKQATIQGRLLVNNDQTVTEQKYSAMAGVLIIASVRYADLNPNGVGAGVFSTRVTTDSRGEFTLTVPATAGGVPVYLAISDVKGSRNEAVVSATGTKNEKKEGKWYFDPPANLYVQSGQTVILSAIVGDFAQIKSSGDRVN